MAAHGDLQELIRMFTSRKVPTIQAMKHVQALQGKNYKTIDQIGEAPLKELETLLADPKLAKSIQTACKGHGKKAKRPATEDGSPPSKKPKLAVHKRDLDYSSMSPAELEASLSLPLTQDDTVLRNTTLVTNRAPLLLAFAVELMRFTMPEQPPSSRLSLAQAVVSANSRSKAVSIGIEKAGPEDGAGLSEGQPKLRVMGREVPVLKRGGYVWSEAQEPTSSVASSVTVDQPSQEKQVWRASQRLMSKGSIFIAHAASITSPNARPELMRMLMAQKKHLEEADHNAWAIRTSYGNSPLVQQASFDDGEQGCGQLMLNVMKEANVTNTVVVLTRYFGGVMLGPDRWRLMRECVNDALSAQQRTATHSGEPVWALDPQDTKPVSSTIGMAIHRPEGARNYLLRSFDTADANHDKKTVTAVNEEKTENLGRLLGALRLLFSSWADVLKPDELDKRAWSWYVHVRPEVEAGPAGWGAKGKLELKKILDLRRKTPESDKV